MRVKVIIIMTYSFPIDNFRVYLWTKVITIITFNPRVDITTFELMVMKSILTNKYHIVNIGIMIKLIPYNNILVIS